MRFIELFAGIGGFRYGLENIRPVELELHERHNGIKDKQQQRQHLACVYANEWNKYAAQIYEKNYEKPDTRDIREVKAKEIPDHELLTAGFPCQSFSVAGKRGGFEYTRGTLFFEVARIAKQKQPRLLLLENVKGLLSHDKGKTFGTILNTLDELGYNCQWQVLNSKDFGVPQNRERVFIIGHLRGTRRPEVFPIGGQDKTTLKELTRNKSQGMRLYSPEGTSTTLAGRAGGWGAKTGLYAIKRGRSTGPWKKTNIAPTVRNGDKADVRAVLTPNRLKKRQNGRRFKDAEEPSFTLTGQDIHGIADGIRIRRLTPTECERLQGFPDGWTKEGIDKDGKTVAISDTQRYKVLGNAVTTNVIATIGKRLKEVPIYMEK